MHLARLGELLPLPLLGKAMKPILNQISAMVLPVAALAAADPVPPATVVTEAEALRIGWPGFAGPRGNVMPLATDVPLVDDLSPARILWVSAGRDLGSAKRASPAASRRFGARPSNLTGSLRGQIAP